jgi:hypothetical protein
MTPPRPQKRPDGTLNALCKTLGLSKRRVSELLSAGMPDDPQAALAWRHERENDDSMAELRRRRIALLREQERLAKIKADEADGLLMPRAEVDQQHIAIASATRTFLKKLESELPSLILGMPLSKAIPATKTYVRGIQTKLSQMDPEFWTHLPENDKP